MEGKASEIKIGGEEGGGFGGLKALHRNNLHFTEGFLTGEA